MRWSSCNRGEEKHGRATEPLSLSEPADPPYTRTHSPNSVRNVNITLTQTNTGISAQTSHSSADRSLRRPSLFYSCSEPSRLAPFTLLSAKRRRKVISLYQVVILVLFCSVRLGLSLSARATWELHCITAWGGSNTRLQIAFTLQQAVPDKWTSYEHSLLDIHQWLATKDAQSKWVFSKKWITIKSCNIIQISE